MNQNKAKRCWQFLLAMFLIPFTFSSVAAQDVRPVSRTYAIENVRIVQAPGKVIESGTIILSNGIIKAVGSNISIPVDALKISADSMTVYAGFIDGLSHTAIPKPKDEQNRSKAKDPGNPSYERAGITPNVTVRDVMDPKDGSIESLRKVGFTTAQVAPYGRMLPGETGIILLSGDAEMLLRDHTGMYATFQGARGVYPNTVIGVMAKFREMYKQAENAKTDGQRYDQNPSNMMRPASDEVLESFYPVISRQIPVVFNTGDVKSMQRAMTLQKELGFSVVLAGVKQGWDYTTQVKSSNVPVFLSLDLPEWKEEIEDSTNTIDDAKEALVKRQVEIITKQYSLPTAWSAQGINFGFSSNGAKASDIHKNLLKMKEAGVSEDVLLAGLTTQPAQILGLSGIMGSIEPGKMANLIITDKNYFEEGAAIRYVFVEGKLHEYDAPKPKKKGGEESGTPTGKWSYTASTPGGDGNGTIELVDNGGALSGTLTDNQSGYSFDLNNVKLASDVLTFDFMYSDGANEIPISVSVNINGSSFSGTVDAAGAGTFPITGKKLPKS